MEYSSNDISAYFQHCPECNTQWRSHHLQTCEHCSTMGLTLVLDDAQIEVLLKAVRTQFYGVNDETDLLTILAEMMRDLWPDVPTALLAQACWMYLSRNVPRASQGSQTSRACFAQRHPSPKKIAIAKEYFEERFQDSLQEYLDEFEWSGDNPHPSPVELTAEE